MNSILTKKKYLKLKQNTLGNHRARPAVPVIDDSAIKKPTNLNTCKASGRIDFILIKSKYLIKKPIYTRQPSI